MDCFFASVAIRNFPQYKNKPVAISHLGKKRTTNKNIGGSNHNDNSLNGIASSASSSSQQISIISESSTSECATCNYKAREYGIKKGMFLGRAKKLCPELIVLHYDFEGYEEVSEQVLEILHRVVEEQDRGDGCSNGAVEAVSCDEAYMELFLDDNGNDNDDDNNTARINSTSSSSKSAHDVAGEIAEMIRREIHESTSCTASIGVADNKFLAKLGTDKVKPNGTFVVRDYKSLLGSLKLRDLHGIGYRTEPKLARAGLVSVRDVWELGDHAEDVLRDVLGPGLAKKIYSFCQGQDDRQVKPAIRKTIGAEVRLMYAIMDGMGIVSLHKNKPCCASKFRRLYVQY